MPGIVRVLGDGGLGLASVKDVRVGLVSRAVWHQLGWCGRGDTGSGFCKFGEHMGGASIDAVVRRQS